MKRQIEDFQQLKPTPNEMEYIKHREKLKFEYIQKEERKKFQEDLIKKET